MVVRLLGVCRGVGCEIAAREWCVVGSAIGGDWFRE
jgi:hypothetical protein